MCGRPVSRKLDDGKTLEINRVCTDGTRNACSMLYGACCRIAKQMGYKKVITYILESEDGASVKANKFSVEHCDYAHITGHSRCCSVEKCDKFERGNRKKVSKQITYSRKDLYKNGKNRI